MKRKVYSVKNDGGMRPRKKVTCKSFGFYRMRIYTFAIFVCFVSVFIKEEAFNSYISSFRRVRRSLVFHRQPYWIYNYEWYCNKLSKVNILEELRQNGFEIKEITLEGLIPPEAIPRDEIFVIYEVTKKDTAPRWFWKGEFLNRDQFEAMYESFVDKHALLDSELLKSLQLYQRYQEDIDFDRHITHLWAILFGKVLGKTKEGVLEDINTKRREIMSRYDTRDTSGLEDEFSIKIEGDVATLHAFVLKFHTYEFFHDFDHPDDIDYSSNLRDIFKKIALYYQSICGENVVEFKEETVKEIQLPEPKDPNIPLRTREFLVKLELKFPKFLMSLIMDQVRFLEDKDKFFSITDAPIATRWKRKFYTLLEQYFGMAGRKAFNLVRLIKSDFPVPLLFIFSKAENLTGYKYFRLPYARVEIGSEEALRNFIRNRINGKLISVRSSPSVSMPGILSTVTNVGMNDEVVEIFAQRCGERFAYETYARFLRSFGTVVFGIDGELFEPLLLHQDAEYYKGLVERYKRVIKAQGYAIPEDPYTQLQMAIKAVKRSWESEVAKKYRAENGIPDDLGMAVIIQEMRFGNLNEDSGSFVLFTRHPVTGEKGVYIEYVPQSQGEDLVEGRVNPIPIEESGLRPEVIEELEEIAVKIEEEFGYVQDIEGVIEDGKIWILQTRDAKLSPEAKAKVLVEMVEEGLLTKEEALERVELEGLEAELTRPRIASEMDEEPIGKGLGASSGAVVGVVALSEEKIKEYKEQELPVILIKEAIYPASDWDVMGEIDGLVTHVGGILSHGAVQARIMGIPAVVGVDMKIEEGMIRIGDLEIKEGEYVTIDGTSGVIYRGKLPLKEPDGVNPYLEILKEWEEELRGDG